jgi:hypothetical protein
MLLQKIYTQNGKIHGGQKKQPQKSLPPELKMQQMFPPAEDKLSGRAKPCNALLRYLVLCRSPLSITIPTA